MLTAKKVNTKKPQIKQCICPKCYDLQTRFVQFTDQKKKLKKLTKD